MLAAAGTVGLQVVESARILSQQGDGMHLDTHHGMEPACDPPACHLATALALKLAVLSELPPPIAFYTGWAHRVMRSKVALAPIRASDHTACCFPAALAFRRKP
jgi:hypothetical protein